MSERIYFDIEDGKTALKNISPGKSFIWTEDKYVCRRVILAGNYDIYDLPQHKLSDGIPVFVVSSAELTVMDAETMVTPCVVEHHVVG